MGKHSNHTPCHTHLETKNPDSGKESGHDVIPLGLKIAVFYRVTLNGNHPEPLTGQGFTVFSSVTYFP
jgi:hypothetical protein